MSDYVNMNGISDYRLALQALASVPAGARKAYFDNVVDTALRRQSDELAKSIGVCAAREWYRNEYNYARNVYILQCVR